MQHGRTDCPLRAALARRIVNTDAVDAAERQVWRVERWTREPIARDSERDLPAHVGIRG
jgi:hypothetical protein